jgi:hypothetical protein
MRSPFKLTQFGHVLSLGWADKDRHSVLRLIRFRDPSVDLVHGTKEFRIIAVFWNDLVQPTIGNHSAVPGHVQSTQWAICCPWLVLTRGAGRSTRWAFVRQWPFLISRPSGRFG